MNLPRKKESKKNPLLLSLLFLFFSLWGCDPRGGGLPDHILVQVNQEQITVNEFDRELKEVVLEPEKDGKHADLGDLKKAYLDQVIERKILVQVVACSELVVPTPLVQVMRMSSPCCVMAVMENGDEFGGIGEVDTASEKRMPPAKPYSVEPDKVSEPLGLPSPPPVKLYKIW